MTLDEARQHIGRVVVYRPFADVIPEQGMITSVDDHWVFVRYGSDAGSQATEPWLLTLAPREGIEPVDGPCLFCGRTDDHDHPLICADCQMPWREGHACRAGFAGAIRDRLTVALNGSGEFRVEASEIDGLTDVRLTVSDKTSGKWITVLAETGDPDDGSNTANCEKRQD